MQKPHSTLILVHNPSRKILSRRKTIRSRTATPMPIRYTFVRVRFNFALFRGPTPRTRIAINIPAQSPNILFSVSTRASKIRVGSRTIVIPVTTTGGTRATEIPTPITADTNPLLWAKIAVIPRRIARIAETSCCSSRERIYGVIGNVAKTVRHAVTTADTMIRTPTRTPSTFICWKNFLTLPFARKTVAA